MTDSPFRIELLAGHDRSQFHCGTAELDDYLKMRASQDVRRRAAVCFLAIDGTNGAIAAYYTLSACHVLLRDIDPEQTRKLPRYPELPAVRLGRLAIDGRYRKRKLGSALLFDAMERARRLDVGACLLLVDAKDPLAADFYKHHGFKAIPGRPLQLISML